MCLEDCREVNAGKWPAEWYSVANTEEELAALIETDAAESGVSLGDEAVAGADQAARESAGLRLLPVGGEKLVFTVHRRNPYFRMKNAYLPGSSFGRAFCAA